MKKLLLMLLGVLMTLPMVARDFEYTYEGQTLTYTVISEDDKTCMTKAGEDWSSAGNEVKGDLVIPAVAVDGDMEYKVTEIGDYAFRFCHLISVTIPNSVSKIGEHAFEYCEKLISVTIPSSVTTIGREAFYWCTSLETITIPESVIEIGEKAFLMCSDLRQIQVEAGNPNYSSVDGVLLDKDQATLIQCPAGKDGDYIIPQSVTKIGNYAFENCNITSVTIPNSVIKIGDYAFHGCNFIVSITIPDSVTEIGEGAFLCYNLKEIRVGVDNPNYSSVNGVLFDKGQTTLIQFPARNNGDYIIPPTVTKIGEYAFTYCSRLTTITIPNSVTEIGEGAFSNCKNLVNITIPDSVVKIGQNAFELCISLTSIPLPDSVTEIGPGAFMNCVSLTSVTIPNSITTIKDYTFLGCSSLTTITIPGSVTEIGQSAFEGCRSLVAITIPGSVNKIVWGAFLECNSIESVYYDAVDPIEADYGVFCVEVYENATLYVPAKAVNKCKWMDPWKNFKNIEGVVAREFEYTYEGQTLTYTVISEDDRTCMTKEGGSWSAGNQVEGDLVIPAVAIDGENEYTVTVIGEGAFNSCTGLSSVSIPNSVTKIGRKAFFGCSSLTAVTIPASVTEIESVSFGCCSNLKEINVGADNQNYSSVDGVLFDKNQTKLIQCPAGKEGDYIIPGTVSEISGCAFQNCGNITAVTIPNSVTIIQSETFEGCYNLAAITIPNSVTEIGGYAFSMCNSLTTVTIPESVTSIGKYAFNACRSLTTVNIPGSVDWIADGVFSSCWSLTTITIPDKAIYIGSYAFCDCRSLTAVTIPDSVTEIGERAFDGCSSLTTLTIPEAITKIGNKSFSDCPGIMSVYYGAEEPIKAKGVIFDTDVYENATLYVPSVAVDKCRLINPWMNFKNIETYDPSGIEDVALDDSPCEVYTVSGVKVGDSTDGLTPGIYIVRQGNDVKKIAVN